MAENTNIEWTDHTFNPWIGCAKVSPGCAHCYAETLMDTRLGQVNWGAGQPRKRTSEANWKQPLKWNAKAQREGTRPRVFCASLADVFDPEVPIEWLIDLLQLIHATPHLNWLLLTKRPEMWAQRMLHAALHAAGYRDGQSISKPVAEEHPVLGQIEAWSHAGKPPANVWLGTTVEDQKRASERIPALLKIPAKIRFLSCEPLLEAVELTGLISGLMIQNGQYAQQTRISDNTAVPPNIHWVICGGESGPRARPMQAEWARALRDQCAAANIPFHFKQWGEWAPNWYNDDNRQKIPDTEWMDKVGKKAAGRQLDGQIHHEFPIQ